MLAAILVESGRPLVVDDVDPPEKLAVGQVRVRMLSSGICGSQLGEIDAAKGQDVHLPHLLGHEGAGVVLEVGPGVRRVKEGDFVALHWRKAAVGIDALPAIYGWRGRPLNAGPITTFGEVTIVAENRVTPMPRGLSADAVALFGCALLTAIGVVHNNAHVSMGESVVVLGQGGVGLAITLVLARVSAYPIAVMDRFANRLELAKVLGATHTWRADEDLAGNLATLLGGGDGADVVIECTGNVRLIEKAYEMTAPRGRTILVGVPPHNENISIHSLPLHFGKVLTGSHGGDAVPDVVLPRLARLVTSGRLDPTALIAERVSLRDVNRAIDAMRSGEKPGRYLIDFGPHNP